MSNTEADFQAAFGTFVADLQQKLTDEKAALNAAVQKIIDALPTGTGIDFAPLIQAVTDADTSLTNVITALPDSLPTTPTPPPTPTGGGGTRAALIIAALLCSFAFSAFAGPDKIVMAPAPTPVPYFRANEWDVSAFGTGVWTQTASHLDRYLGVDHAFGGALDGAYFFTENFGVGAGFTGLAVNNSSSVESGFLGQVISALPAAGNTGFVGTILPKVIARYPIGQFAIYGFGGLGAAFNGGNTTLTAPNGLTGNQLKFQAIEHDVKVLIEPGIGAEYRFTPNIGVKVEGAFDKIDRPNSNYFTVRAGMSVAF